MKKKLEAELISIAHRILKLKNKSELDQLYLEVQKLYEKLAVLKFVEENFADIKPTIGQQEAQEILETAFDEKTEDVPAPEVEETAEKPKEEPTPVAAVDKEEKPAEDDAKEEEKIQEPDTKEEEKLQNDATPTEKEVDEVIAEAEEELAGETVPENESDESGQNRPQTEETVSEAGIAFEQPEAVEEAANAAPDEPKNDDTFKPSFEWSFNARQEEATEAKQDKAESQEQPQSQIAFEDLLGAGYKDPVFVKPEDETKETDVPAEDNRIDPVSSPLPDVIPINRRDDKVPVFKINNENAVSLNDRLSKGITVGLNDRIAFVKNLFNNSNEDYNRVLSQLITFDTFGQAQDFIDNMVKPDYNNWEGKEEFEQRFMEVVEKKFS